MVSQCNYKWITTCSNIFWNSLEQRIFSINSFCCEWVHLWKLLMNNQANAISIAFSNLWYANVHFSFSHSAIYVLMTCDVHYKTAVIRTSSFHSCLSTYSRTILLILSHGPDPHQGGSCGPGNVPLVAGQQLELLHWYSSKNQEVNMDEPSSFPITNFSWQWWSKTPNSAVGNKVRVWSWPQALVLPGTAATSPVENWGRHSGQNPSIWMQAHTHSLPPE